MVDRETGRSRGFGFVTVATEHMGNAIAEMNGANIDGREIRVNEAQAKGSGGGEQSLHVSYAWRVRLHFQVDTAEVEVGAMEGAAEVEEGTGVEAVEEVVVDTEVVVDIEVEAANKDPEEEEAGRVSHSITHRSDA